MDELTPSCLHPRLRSPVPASQVPYKAFMETEDGFFDVLEHMCLSGLCILKNVPVRERMVKQVAEKIAPISYNLLYGDVWDVKPTANVWLRYCAAGLVIRRLAPLTCCAFMSHRL